MNAPDNTPPDDPHSLQEALRRLEAETAELEADLEPLRVRRRVLKRERDRVAASVAALGHSPRPREAHASKEALRRDELRDYNDQRGHRRLIFDSMATDHDRAWSATELLAHLTATGSVDLRGRPLTLETLRRTMGRMVPSLLMVDGAEVNDYTGHPQRLYRINPGALPPR
jgi:nicotinamidase-related amidase